MVSNRRKLLFLLGGILLLLILRPRFWIGGWETQLEPVKATEVHSGKTKDLRFTNWQGGFDFDQAFSGAPNIWVQVMSWTHTSGQIDPITGYYTKTDWDDVAQRFDISYTEMLPQPDGSKVNKVVTQEYDLHLFWTLIQVGTAADVKIWGYDTLGNARLEHETSYTDHTVMNGGDLGRAAEVDLTLEVDITPWPIRNMVDDFQKAGIMSLQALPYPFYRENKVRQTAAGEDWWKGEKKSELEYDDVIRGTMVARGMPQSGVYAMKWPDQTEWQRREITSEGDLAQLPTALPLKLLITPRVWLRCGYVVGKSQGFVYDAVKALIPVDMYVQFGVLMEVLTIAEHIVYSDPYGITLTTPTKYETYIPEPSPWAGLGDFLKKLWPWGGLMGLGLLLVVIVVVLFLLKKSPQYQIYRRFKD